MNQAISKALLLLAPLAAYAAAPGITGPTFNLTAQAAYLSQPDGAAVYSWGYGCSSAPTGFNPPASLMPGATCNTMQVPGPTLIVTEGQTVTVHLANGLPAAAGNTSILFPGFNVTATGGVAGLLTQEAAPGGTVTYTFVASSPGTRAYYSGTQGDLQVEMGLYGAIIVLPASVPGNCTSGLAAANLAAEAHWGESDFRLTAAAYDHARSCYDREYLFQFSEMDPDIHKAALAQVNATTGCAAGAPGCSLNVPTEPYHPAYFMINGRSMPDDMDPNYASQYPHQPYNGNPHMHPGEQVLLRIIGQGRWQHPFHEHGNHVRILARDGNLIHRAPAHPTHSISRDRCCSPLQRRQGWRWMGFFTGQARV
jgi:FtsP/CotA-like multicopper oxidase with cupredoxin domain